jgi:saccharopine dehydrogenase-like NADP-dependent oxidoreductase
MRILLVGAGGVGDAFAKIAVRRDFFETIVVSDYDLARAERTLLWLTQKHGDQGDRFVAAKIDASDPESVAAVAREHRATHVMNAGRSSCRPSSPARSRPAPTTSTWR